jgi:broad specificity phosphatase PhoE
LNEHVELLLVRHAQTTSNVAHALDTAHPGADLTDLGRQQAEALADLLVDERIDAIWCSPRRRTRRTAQRLAADRGVEPTFHDGLVEVLAGDLEMSTAEADAATYRDVVATWLVGDRDVRMPGGENGHEALGRFDAVIEDIVSRGHERVAIVSHGAILRLWAGVNAANVHPEMHPDLTLGNTGLIRLRGDAGGWSATEWDRVSIEPGGDAGPI